MYEEQYNKKSKTNEEQYNNKKNKKNRRGTI
jgi:hypothetical protein